MCVSVCVCYVIGVGGLRCGRRSVYGSVGLGCAELKVRMCECMGVWVYVCKCVCVYGGMVYVYGCMVA